MKKELPDISVRKVPNGYILRVGQKEYLAFDPDQLTDQFFTHVAIGITGYLNRDMAAALLEAAATYKTVGEALEAVATWIAAARKAEKHELAAMKGQANANQRAEKAETERDRLLVENSELRLKVTTLERKLTDIGTKLVGCPSVKESKPKSDYRIRKRDIEPKKKRKRSKKA